MQCGAFAEIQWNCKGGTLIEINENIWKFNENQWKYKENATNMQCGGFAEIQWNCKGGTIVEINENLWKLNEIQWKYMKIQRTCNVAALPKFNESTRGYPCRNQWKSMKIH